jgi:hypothetical protein
MQDPPTGTRGTSTTPDTTPNLAALVAASEAKVARHNAMSADEAAAIAEHRRVVEELDTKLTAKKRAMATPEFGPDLSQEHATATRQAFVIVRQRVAWRAAVAAPRQTAAVPPSTATPVRPRERRDKAGRSSARSGDSGSDSDGPEPPGDWRWGQPARWADADPRSPRRNRRVRQLVAS